MILHGIEYQRPTSLNMRILADHVTYSFLTFMKSIFHFCLGCYCGGYSQNGRSNLSSWLYFHNITHHDLPLLLIKSALMDVVSSGSFLSYFFIVIQILWKFQLTVTPLQDILLPQNSAHCNAMWKISQVLNNYNLYESRINFPLNWIELWRKYHW